MNPQIHRSFLASFVTCSLLLPAQTGLQPITSPSVVPPRMILNEVVFDAGGVDGSTEAVAEWIELLVLSDNTNLSQFRLENNQGRVLGGLPNRIASKGSVVVLCLGTMIPPGMDSSLGDKSAAFATGAPPGDYLDNDFGGVRLRNLQTNVVVDALYWGKGSAPPGTGVGPWGAGQYLDIGFAAGRPVDEGDSVGRSAHETNYPGSPADWSPHGGAVAAAPSPGRRNDLLHVYPSDLLSWAQSGFNEVILQYGDMLLAPGIFSVTNAQVDGVTITYPTAFSMQVQATHALTVEEYGIAKVYSGTLTCGVIIDPDVATLGYTLAMNGTLTEPGGNSVSIVHTSVFGGFSSGPRTLLYSTEVDWFRDGQLEWFDIYGNANRTRTGDDGWLWTDTRTATDYASPAAKVCTSSSTITRVSDGRLHNVFALDRPFPSGPSWSPPGVESLVIETDSTIKPDGTVSADVLRFDQVIDGQPLLSLQPEQVGHLVVARTGDATTATFSAQMTVPLRYDSGPDFVMENYADGTVTVANGKYVMSGVRGHRFNGNLAGESQFYIDPPLLPTPAPQQGQGGTTVNGSNNTVINIGNVSGGSQVIIVVPPSQPQPPATQPPAPAPQPPAPSTGGSSHSLGGLGTAAVACVGTGAAVGSGTGTVTLPVVGTVTGAVGGGIIGGAVCGGGYLASWAWEWLTE